MLHPILLAVESLGGTDPLVGQVWGNNSETWGDVIDLLDLNLSDALLFDFCANHSFTTSNSVFEHKVLLIEFNLIQFIVIA